MAQGSLRGTLAGNAINTTNPFSATGSVAVSVGDLIYVQHLEDGTSLATAMADNLGNTYSNIYSNATDYSKDIWYSVVTSAGTLTSINATVTASSANILVHAAVFEGKFATPALDVNPAINIDKSPPIDCPATGTLAQAAELVIAWHSGDGSTPATATCTAPLVKAIGTSNGGSASAIGYKTVASTATTTPQFTTGGAGHCYNGTHSFKFSLAAAYTLTATPTAISVGSPSVTLRRGRKLVPTVGTISVGSPNITLRLSVKLTVTNAPISVGSPNVSLLVVRKISPLVGTISVDAKTVNLIYTPFVAGHHTIDASVGGIIVGAPQVTLTQTHAYSLQTDVGNIIVGAPSVDLVYAPILSDKVMTAETAQVIVGTEPVSLVVETFPVGPGVLRFGRPVWLSISGRW